MKKVFYIEKSDFLRTMMELALKAKGAEIFTTAHFDHSNYYLLEDLKPDLIIFDTETCQSEYPTLFNYAKANSAILVSTGIELTTNEMDSKQIKQHLDKPFTAHTLAQRILSLLD